MKMKKIVFAVVMSACCSMAVLAQEKEEKENDKPSFADHLFTGGSVTVSFFNQQSILGANPMLGYQVTNWLDAGLAYNFVYTWARDYQQYDDKIRQTVMGPGVFTRIYPVSIIFLQAQFEHNFIKQKYIYPGGTPTDTYKVDASSLLVGAGLAQGRFKGGRNFYYVSILFDVLKNANSPYTRVSVNPNNPTQQRVDVVPVIRAGLNIALGKGDR
jgi:hypothetical protein